MSPRRASQVQADGVNGLDWKIRSGAMHDVMPVSFPYVRGIEFAGVVERVGVPAESLTLKPPSPTFEEAAAVPIGAITAWQALTINHWT